MVYCRPNPCHDRSHVINPCAADFFVSVFFIHVKPKLQTQLIPVSNDEKYFYI